MTIQASSSILYILRHLLSGVTCGRYRPVVSKLATLPLAVPTLLVAQDTQGGDQLPRCASCRITVDTLVTLHDPTGRIQPDPFRFPTVVKDSRGWYYVAPLADRHYIGVYEPDGRAVRVIGGSGIEPGMFLYLPEVKIRNDTLIGVDRGGRELELIPLRGGEPRTVRLGYGPEGVLPLPDGGFVTQLNLSSPATMGMPLHIHRNNGDHVRTFGRSIRRISPNAPYDLKRNIAIGGDGSLLVSWVNRYRIERWTESGSLVGVYEQQRPWFKPWSNIRGSAKAVAPNTWFESIRLDETIGLLWCVFHVADADWTPEPGATKEGHQIVPRLAERWRYYDTIIEAIDLTSGDLVHSRRLDEFISGYLNDGSNLYSVRTEDVDGQQQMHLLRLEISGWP